MISANTTWIDFWGFPLASQFISHVGKRYFLARQSIPNSRHIWRNSDPFPDNQDTRQVLYWTTPTGFSDFSLVEYELWRRDGNRAIQLCYGGNSPQTTIPRFASHHAAMIGEQGFEYPMLTPDQSINFTELWSSPSDREYVAIVRDDLDEARIMNLLAPMPPAQEMFARRHEFGVRAEMVHQVYLQSSNGVPNHGMEAVLYLSGFPPPSPDGPPEAARNFLWNGELIWSLYRAVPPLRFTPHDPFFIDEVLILGRNTLDFQDYFIYEGFFNVNGTEVGIP
jgi:hypothetical protein